MHTPVRVGSLLYKALPDVTTVYHEYIDRRVETFLYQTLRNERLCYINRYNTLIIRIPKYTTLPNLFQKLQNQVNSQTSVS